MYEYTQDVMMMEKEIKIMKELQHQNIVQYKTDFKVKEGWFIVLEYCGKGDMEHYKQKIGKNTLIQAKFHNFIVNCLSEAF